MASPNIIPTGWNKEEEEYQFTGELKAEFFQGSKKIKEIIITDFGFAGFQDNLMTYYSSISLATFTLPIEGRLLRKTKLKLTLIKPDKFLKEHNNNVWLDISVSSSP